MRKVIIQVLFFFILGISLNGCGSSGIQMRSYSQDRPRVDQEIPGVDNEGYVGGSMQSSNIARRKKTRKVYVLEIVKGAGDIKSIKGDESSVVISDVSSDQVMDISNASVTPVTFVEEERIIKADEPSNVISVMPTLPSEYTVEKDDTLQKIAKKFYNSYSKWLKIYEANKSVILNPDRLRTGTVLQIPQD